jgi:hypothetical protein
MRIVGLSREGCKVILPLAMLTLFLADVALHSFAPRLETIPFFVLILFCFLRLIRQERKESK